MKGLLTTLGLLGFAVTVLLITYSFNEMRRGAEDPFGWFWTSAHSSRSHRVQDPHSLPHLQQAYADWDTGKLPRR